MDHGKLTLGVDRKFDGDRKLKKRIWCQEKLHKVPIVVKRYLGFKKTVEYKGSRAKFEILSEIECSPLQSTVLV